MLRCGALGQTYMLDYRLYFFDVAGHVRGMVQLACDDDDEAAAWAKTHGEGRTMELWHRDRQIRTFVREED
jgi:hypothetical protein